VLIVGNGGAARGAAFALSDAGAKIALTGRNPDRVRALAKICAAEALAKEQLAGRHFDAVVHATPLGMFPHVDECFFDGAIPADVVFDMVYNPLETVLLRRAGNRARPPFPASTCSSNRPWASLKSGPERPRRAPSCKKRPGGAGAPCQRSTRENETHTTATGNRARAGGGAGANRGPAGGGGGRRTAGARNRVKTNGETLAGQAVPMAVEPAFQFKA
jgi:hypothetical protein